MTRRATAAVLVGLVFAAVAGPAARAVTDADDVAPFVRLALECARQEYPNKIAHVMQSDADVGTPSGLTPAFYGCFDWHSSVHGHWQLTRFARLFPDHPLAAEARAVLDAHLTDANIAAETAYLLGEGRASWERPYGLAWLLQLSAELREWDTPDARRWAAALLPLEDACVERLADWLPKLAYPIRTGEHSQTAFAFGLALDYARSAGRKDLALLIEETGRRLYLPDPAAVLAFEPSGQDFLSPALAEADFLRRVLEPEAFAAWLDGFLPEIPAAGGSDWLPVAVVTDRSDGKLAHLDGLNLSRAWMLAGIAAGLPYSDSRLPALVEAAAAHREAGLAAVTGEHYEGGHWLGTYALYLESGRGLGTGDPDRDLVLHLRTLLWRNDMDAARNLLGANPRVWWEERAGEGAPWIPGDDRWRDWDEHFRARSRILAWEIAFSGEVRFVVEEMNDYYALTGRGPQRHRRHYWVAAGKITGTMIEGVDTPGSGDSLFPEFEAWAQERHPDAFADLVPEGEIDPSGDHAPRMRELLNAWRESRDLPPVESD